MEREWTFPSNNYGEIQGINNAGVETFSATKYESLIREAIQNSLDAKRKDVQDSVIVKIQQEHICPNKIPGHDSLGDAFKKCLDVKSNDDKTTNFFNNAYRNITQLQNKVHILKISDFNTTGLSGGKNGEMGSPWSRLVKESGTNDKSGDAGGSFGIGKSAYFACSNMRTVFFSSLSEDGEKSNVGVAKLISFDCDDGTKTMGTGFCARGKELVAFEELADFDGAPLRSEPGTDIYIIDYSIDDGSLYEKLEYYVISNFLISIMKEKLVVYLGDDIVINTSYVDTFFEKYRKEAREDLSSEKKELLDYYNIFKNDDNKTEIVRLNSKEDYGSQYGFADNECTLFLRKGDDLNRGLLVTRKTGMKLFLQKRISSSIIFSGILYIEGPNMNKFFRDMETPAHDKWVPRNDYQKKAFDELKNYIKRTVIRLFDDQIGDEFDAFDAGQFLPDLLVTGDSATENNSNPGFLSKAESLSMKTMKPSKKKFKQADLLKDKDIFRDEKNDNGENAEEGGEHTGTGSEPGTGTIHNSGDVNGFGMGTGDGLGEGTNNLPGDGNITNAGEPTNPEKDYKNKKYKETTIGRRVICLDPKAGLYNINIFVPNKAKYAKLDFSLAGEQSDIDLHIQNAKIISGSASILEISNNKIFLENLKKGEQLKLAIEVIFKDYCMMEVDYYESKK